jgi:hypothetical protein
MTMGEEGDGEAAIERVQRHVLLRVVVLWRLTLVDSEKVRVVRVASP